MKLKTKNLELNTLSRVILRAMQLWSVPSSKKSPPRFTKAIVVTMLLLAALGCARREERPADSARFVKWDRPPIHAFIADDRSIECPVVGGMTVDQIFSQQTPACWLTDGWSRAFEWGTWATRLASEFEVHITTPDDRILSLRARASASLPADQQQFINLRVNGRVLESQEISRTFSRLRFEVPAESLRMGRNRFSLEFTHLTPTVGSATKKVEVSQAAAISEMALVTSDRQSERATGPVVDLWNTERGLLLIDQPGTLVLPIFVPHDATGFELGFRSAISADGPAHLTRLSIFDLDGGAEHHTEIELSSRGDPTVGRLPVTTLSGRWGLVTLTAETATRAVEVTGSRFVTDNSESDDADGGEERNQRPPNIVVITLDAARADRFSFNGHHRETTPFIDSLAEESLVFSNAFSLVPYTLCSVPTMITGLSFLDHGVVNHEDVLSPDAVTLAEYLRDAGYRTAAFSATPNNSQAKGFDQGYDVFREMWTEDEKKVSRRAPYIAQRVVEWLEKTPDDGNPFHLQVHMVPPHAPYDPPPAFDRYTDPAYDGPCDGWPRTIFNLNAGVVPATRECVDHVLALYDGNLNVADNATKTIIEALQRRPGWDNTMVLVTSDHGEAFMEHGRIGHNATLYNEMLHVPFVLRMPGPIDEGNIDTRGLVTLTDIVPTLLHAAGVDAPVFTDGFDLLDSTARRDGRFMVGRTATKTPVLGLRTLRWNLMVNPAGSGGLFDQTTDPDEMRNLIGEHPEIYAGLGKILTTRIAVPQQLNASQTSDLSDEERELLETLGYIR